MEYIFPNLFSCLYLFLFSPLKQTTITNMRAVFKFCFCFLNHPWGLWGEGWKHTKWPSQNLFPVSDFHHEAHLCRKWKTVLDGMHGCINLSWPNYICVLLEDDDAESWIPTRPTQSYSRSVFVWFIVFLGNVISNSGHADSSTQCHIQNQAGSHAQQASMFQKSLLRFLSFPFSFRSSDSCWSRCSGWKSGHHLRGGYGKMK